MSSRNTQEAHKSLLSILRERGTGTPRQLLILWGTAYLDIVCWGDRAMLGSNPSTQQKEGKEAEAVLKGGCLCYSQKQAHTLSPLFPAPLCPPHTCLFAKAINPDERSEESPLIILNNMDKYCIPLFCNSLSKRAYL